VHLGLGHDNSFSPLFLAAPAPELLAAPVPGLTPAPVPRNAFLAAWPRHAPSLRPAGPRRPTQPNAQNTSLVNK
jgi:hypothetical protein